MNSSSHSHLRVSATMKLVQRYKNWDTTTTGMKPSRHSSALQTSPRSSRGLSCHGKERHTCSLSAPHLTLLHNSFPRSPLLNDMQGHPVISLHRSFPTDTETLPLSAELALPPVNQYTANKNVHTERRFLIFGLKWQQTVSKVLGIDPTLLYIRYVFLLPCVEEQECFAKNVD